MGCTLDRVIPAAHQEEMIKNAKDVEPTAFDVVVKLESGNELIYSRVSDLVGILVGAARC